MSAARMAMENFERVGRKAERNLDNLEEFTGPLGDIGEQLLRDVSDSAENLEQLPSQLLVFSEAINNPDGTLGQDDPRYSE